MGQSFLILRKILSGAQLASQWLVPEPPDDIAKLLRMLVQYWLLSNQGSVEWLQIRAWTGRRETHWILLGVVGRVPILVIFSNRSTVLRPLLLSKAAHIRPRFIRSARNRRVLYCAIDSFLDVVAARSHVLLGESLGEMVLADALAVGPLDCSARRG